MSHNPIRKDKTCLNCTHLVEERFCPNCGQENSESRKTFHHLFIHFFEDLTHYENAFWRTIKNLLFKPASLTIEYLSGKRLSYLAPVRLYIFISFITFFLINVFADNTHKLINFNTHDTSKAKIKIVKSYEQIHKEKKIELLLKSGVINKKEADSLKNLIAEMQKKKASEFLNFGYKSQKQIDSLYKYGKGEDEMSDLEHWFASKTQYVNDHNTKEAIIEKFKVSFVHDFPKVLFIYMPFFAFFLWLFHNKKRWYYFDHGIFTLHYFSFLLLIALLLFLLSRLFTSLFNIDTAQTIIDIIYFIGFGWMFYYFYPAHRRFYGESVRVSFVKSSVLFMINFIFIFILLFLFAIYTFINLH